MTSPVRVLIADDHALSSAGLQRALETRGFDVLPVCGSGIEAIARAKAEQPDLAILDHHMPGATGLEVLAELRRWSPATKVVILTGRATEGLLAAMALARPDGVFLKTGRPDALLAGLDRVLGGTRVMPEIGPTPAALSQRELQVLGCIAQGLSNPAIAERLAISVKTVESHRASAMRKLGVNSTASLVMAGIRQGLISDL